MAKKVKNFKLLKKDNIKQDINSKMAFNNFAKKVQLAKEKKIQKMGDTKQRLISNKKTNKILRLPNAKSLKKINKFSLLDDQQAEEKQQGLTHKGKLVKEIKHFNDMDFQEDDMSELFQHEEQLNFGGFDEEQGNEEREKRPKTKNQIYKEIIEKSKQHKKDRQEQYEQNFNTAVELDEQFTDLASMLKFRTHSSKLRDKLASKSTKQSLQYDRLMNQLKQDERVVANKVVENTTKGTQKIKKKKNEQINLLMKNKNDEQEEDIRGWVNNIEEQSGQEGDEDELDDVELSSGDEDDGDEDEDEEEEDEDEDGEEDDEGESNSEQLDEGSQEDDLELDDDNFQFEDEEEQDDGQIQIVQESSSSLPPAKQTKNPRKKKKYN